MRLGSLGHIGFVAGGFAFRMTEAAARVLPADVEVFTDLDAFATRELPAQKRALAPLRAG